MKLRTGYFIVGIVTGLILLANYIGSLPDGKLHLVVCDVGQGDSIYIRFPDGRDLLVDGGPGNRVLTCLGNHMPFWDRSLDLVLLTHPDSDHITGLLSVLSRYRIGVVVRSDSTKITEGFSKFQALVREKQIPEKLVAKGEQIAVGSVQLGVVWPPKPMIAGAIGSSVLGASVPPGDTNEGSVVFSLQYGTFDALFPGDAEGAVTGSRPGLGGQPFDGVWEFLKVPHHGSKLMTIDKTSLAIRQPAEFLLRLTFENSKEERPLAVISVGKNNTYGHPAFETIALLEEAGFQVLRTDEAGDIEVVSDGKWWEVKQEHQ